MCRKHIIYHRPYDNEEIYYTYKEYEAEAKSRGDNFRRCVTFKYDFDFWGRARGVYDPIRIYFHHSSYREIDYGLYKESRGINTNFEMNRKVAACAPKRGDFICGFMKPWNYEYNGIFYDGQFSPWHIMSFNEHRLFQCILRNAHTYSYFLNYVFVLFGLIFVRVISFRKFIRQHIRHRINGTNSSTIVSTIFFYPPRPRFHSLRNSNFYRKRTWHS